MLFILAPKVQNTWTFPLTWIARVLNSLLLWKRIKCTVISYSCIFYFGHACLKLNFVLIYLFTVKCATQNVKKLTQCWSIDMVTYGYYGYIKEPKDKWWFWPDCIASTCANCTGWINASWTPCLCSFPNNTPTLGSNASCFCAAKHTCKLHGIGSLLALGRCCSGVTDSGPTLIQHWLCWLCYNWNNHYMHWNDVVPSSAMVAEHWTYVGKVYPVYVVHYRDTTPGQHNSLSCVESTLASVGNGGPALNRHWISIMLTCSGHKHYLKIVINFE